MNKVVDRAGVELEPGQTVIVHQDYSSRRAVVVKILHESPTLNAEGRWVDIIFVGPAGAEVPEAVPSYVLEVFPAVKDDTPRCRCCGVPFEKHLGVEGTCQRIEATRTVLRELIRVIEASTERLGKVHGELFAAAHLSEVLVTTAWAKRSLW